MRTTEPKGQIERVSHTKNEAQPMVASQRATKAEEPRHFCRGRPHEWETDENGTMRCAKCPAVHTRPATPEIEHLLLQYKAYKELQETRKRIANQEGADQRVRGLSEVSTRLSWQPMSPQLEGMEGSWKRSMERDLPGVPVYDQFLSKIRGVGPVFSAALVGTIRDMRYFEQASSLWHYFGQHTVEGRAPRSKKGQKDDHDRELKALCHNIAESFVRSGGYYRLKYDERKAVEAAKHHDYGTRDTCSEPMCPGCCFAKVEGRTCSPPGHIENRTRRWVVKLFLSHLYAAWRELEGLPVREPYPQEYQGHKGFISWYEAVAYDESPASHASCETQSTRASHRSCETQTSPASQGYAEPQATTASHASPETQSKIASHNHPEPHDGCASQGDLP